MAQRNYERLVVVWHPASASQTELIYSGSFIFSDASKTFCLFSLDCVSVSLFYSLKMPWEFNHAKEFSEYPSFLGLGDRLNLVLEKTSHIGNKS